MKTKLVVTDFTRMHRGRVCIAGYDGDHRCIRPILPPPGILESSLYSNGKALVFPFALIELDLLEATPQPPHTEDVRYAPDSIRYIRHVSDRRSVLGWSLFPSVSAIFEQPILTGPGHYVLDCQGARSLGTVQPGQIHEVKYEPGDEGNWDYRLCFWAGDSTEYRLKITDLTWQRYCSSLRGEEQDPSQIAVRLTEKLKESQVYLRIGLARGWQEYPERCYLQITGVYTIPDYLDGMNLYDLYAARV